MKGGAAEGGEAASAGRDGDEDEGPVGCEAGGLGEDIVGSCDKTACMIAVCCMANLHVCTY